MLAALPVILPKRALHATGRTMGQAWDAWTQAGRVNYLRTDEFALELTGHGEDVQVERVWLDTSEPDGEVSRVSDHVRGVIMTNGAFVWYDDQPNHRGDSPQARVSAVQVRAFIGSLTCPCASASSRPRSIVPGSYPCASCSAARIAAVR
jgi:hypothetical protein